MLVFYKKELKEHIKTHKLLIFILLGVFFAYSGVLLTKFLKPLYELLGMGEEIVSMIPDPTIEGVFVDFLANTGTVFLIILILGAGIVCKEKSKNTLSLVLPKGLSRVNFIISKYLSYASILTIFYIICTTLTIILTQLLFGEWYFNELFMGLFLYYIYGLYLIALALFFSTLTKSYGISVMFTILTYGIFSTLALIPKIDKFIPSNLAHVSRLYLLNGWESDMTYTIVSAVAFIIIFLTSSILIFRKQQL